MQISEGRLKKAGVHSRVHFSTHVRDEGAAAAYLEIWRGTLMRSIHSELSAART